MRSTHTSNRLLHDKNLAIMAPMGLPEPGGPMAASIATVQDAAMLRMLHPRQNMRFCMQAYSRHVAHQAMRQRPGLALLAGVSSSQPEHL